MEAHSPPSPLTGSNRTRLVDQIYAAELVEIYAKDGLDIRADIGNISKIAVWECLDSGLKFTVPCITGSAKFYADIERNGLEYSLSKYEYELARPFIRPNDKVLDVGCGFGHFSSCIPEAKFTGLEFSEHAAQIGRRAGRNILTQGIEEHAATFGQKYDVVTSFQVIEHVRDPKSFLDACIACLRPGGRLFIGVPADDAFPGISINGIYNLPPHHVTLWPDRALEFALEAAGIRDCKLMHEPLSDEHRLYYATQILLRAIRGPHAPHRYVRRDLVFRLQNKVAAPLAKILVRAFVGKKMLAFGHTVVATGIKPGA
jgi:SAM-dependent methyltransferase